MPLPLIPLAIGLAGTLGKLVFSGKQRAEADRLRTGRAPYAVNNEVVDNARINGERFTNYNMPGYSKILSDLEGSYANSVATAAQGATSSADVLDAATRAQYGLGRSVADLEVNNAQGKERALGEYLQSKALAGNEFKEKNAYERETIDQQIAQSQQLQAAGTQNAFSAADQATKLVSSLFSYNKNTLPQTTTGFTKQEELFKNFLSSLEKD